MVDNIALIANAIMNAQSGVPVEILPQNIQILSDNDAYLLQDLINSQMGGVGAWKVARAPDGVYRCSAIPSQRISFTDQVSQVIFSSTAKIEFELGVRFRQTINESHLPKDLHELVNLIDCVFPAIEIISSRLSPHLQSFKSLQLADHQNCQMVIVDKNSTKHHLTEPLKLTVRAYEKERIFIVDSERLSRINQSLLWLCKHAIERGRPIQEGDFIITGALIGPEPISFNKTYEIAINENHFIKKIFFI